MLQRVLLVIYVAYCVEVGIFLFFFPWMRLWEQHSLLQQVPYLKLLFLNHFFRGGVSGLGVANLILGAWEVAGLTRFSKKA